MNVFRLACCRSYATGTDRVGRDGAFPTLKKQHYPPPQLKQQHPDLYDRYEVSFTTRSSEDGSNNSTGGDTSHSPSSSSPRSRTPSPPVPGDSVGVTDTTNVLGISRRFHGAVDYNDGDDEGAFGGGGGGRVGRPRQQQQQLSYGSRRRNRKKRSMCSTTTTMNAAMRLHHQRRNGINPPGAVPTVLVLPAVSEEEESGCGDSRYTTGCCSQHSHPHEHCSEQTGDEWMDSSVSSNEEEEEDEKKDSGDIHHQHESDDNHHANGSIEIGKPVPSDKPTPSPLNPNLKPKRVYLLPSSTYPQLPSGDDARSWIKFSTGNEIYREEADEMMTMMVLPDDDHRPHHCHSDVVETLPSNQDAKSTDHDGCIVGSWATITDDEDRVSFLSTYPSLETKDKIPTATMATTEFNTAGSTLSSISGSSSITTRSSGSSSQPALTDATRIHRHPQEVILTTTGRIKTLSTSPTTAATTTAPVSERTPLVSTSPGTRVGASGPWAWKKPLPGPLGYRDCSHLPLSDVLAYETWYHHGLLRWRPTESSLSSTAVLACDGKERKVNNNDADDKELEIGRPLALDGTPQDTSCDNTITITPPSKQRYIPSPLLLSVASSKSSSSLPVGEYMPFTGTPATNLRRRRREPPITSLFGRTAPPSQLSITTNLFKEDNPEIPSTSTAIPMPETTTATTMDPIMVVTTETSIERETRSQSDEESSSSSPSSSSSSSSRGTSVSGSAVTSSSSSLVASRVRYYQEYVTAYRSYVGHRDSQQAKSHRNEAWRKLEQAKRITSV